SRIEAASAISGPEIHRGMWAPSSVAIAKLPNDAPLLITQPVWIVAGVSERTMDDDRPFQEIGFNLVRRTATIGGHAAMRRLIQIMGLIGVLAGAALAAAAQQVDLQDVRRQAEAGDPTAQFNLGVAYSIGDGVAEDFSQAA